MPWFKRDAKESTPVKGGMTFEECMTAIGAPPVVSTKEEYQEYLARKAHSDNQWQRIECYGYNRKKK